GDDGYFQRFRLDDGPDGRPVELTNVVGYLPGRLAERDGQAVVVGAHYDHLGFGWPDAHRQFEGQLHPGADDNASGVAVLLELARVFAAGEAPDRALVFVAFTAEESGRLGSRHFVEHSGRLPAEAVRAMVNLDTVGRLGDGPVTVMSTGTAEEWPHIVRGVGFVTGIAGRSVEDSLSASDEASFIEHGVPAIQLFTAAHADYHRPSDTADKVDRTGLVKVATFAREIVSYLVGREEPLTVTIDGHVAPAGQPSAGRRVSFGIVPDFGFAGPGVRADSVVPDSPADRAGIRGGDVLTEVDGRPVADLRELAAILAGLAPGRSVGAVVERDGTRLELSVTLVAR
ncbi:MAG TPA: M20/M25/M40 family metallo-hydrolase, partial [Candidatus Polarisedimenticolaceae bacterium]|nr:M20/M25/M40 family metallo-hydrolase [Candidatus Polarisedimenticolaceae bacterium]